MKAIGEIAAADQRQFLVFYGNIYNYGDTEITIHDVDIKLTIGQSVNTDVVLPSVDLMNAFRSANNLDISFPDRNLPFYPDFKVPAHKAQATVLVYDVPADATLFKIQFFSETPNLSIFVWFETQPVTVHKIAQLALSSFSTRSRITSQKSWIPRSLRSTTALGRRISRASSISRANRP
ncbi:hypothetical protein FBR00_14455 [Anaerolineae bacterium CFX4]|nr:hypothetical protein [Anaerolineae bacterium CFX4]